MIQPILRSNFFVTPTKNDVTRRMVHTNSFFKKSPPVSAKKVKKQASADCISQWWNLNNQCIAQNLPPNPFNPNEGWNDWWNWITSSSRSGLLVDCWKNAAEEFKVCMAATERESYQISNYRDYRIVEGVQLPGRMHTFPCDGYTTTDILEYKNIMGCDGFYPSNSFDEKFNHSKGVVKTCEINANPNFCTCPNGAQWNPNTFQCQCYNAAYVTHYGENIANCCGPPCSEGKVYDCLNQICVNP